MIKMLAIFVLLAIVVMIGITLFQNTTGKEKLAFLKVVWYGLLCSAISVGILSVIVLLF